METPPWTPSPPTAAPAQPADTTTPSTLRSDHHRHHRLSSNRAVTLVEVCVAMSILVLVSVGLISVTYQVRSTAEQAVYQNTALTLAQAYLEQLRSLDYTSLSAAAQSTANSLPLINASGAIVMDEAGGALNSTDWARETIYLDVNAAAQPTQPLRFRFKPTLTLIPGSNALGVEMTIQYEASHLAGISRTYTGALRSVRSSVPTY